MSRRVATGKRVGRELAKHGVIPSARAEQVGTAVAAAWDTGDYTYRTVLAAITRRGETRDVLFQRGIARTARTFGVQLS